MKVDELKLQQLVDRIEHETIALSKRLLALQSATYRLQEQVDELHEYFYKEVKKGDPEKGKG